MNQQYKISQIVSAEIFETGVVKQTVFEPAEPSWVLHQPSKVTMVLTEKIIDNEDTITLTATYENIPRLGWVLQDEKWNTKSNPKPPKDLRGTGWEHNAAFSREQLANMRDWDWPRRENLPFEPWSIAHHPRSGRTLEVVEFIGPWAEYLTKNNINIKPWRGK